MPRTLATYARSPTARRLAKHIWAALVCAQAAQEGYEILRDLFLNHPELVTWKYDFTKEAVNGNHPHGM